MKRVSKAFLALLSIFAMTGCAEGPQGPKGDTGETGLKGDKGDPGNNGVSVVSITLANTVGKVKTYVILYSDGTTSSFNVEDGEDGQQGSQGIQGNTGADGHTPEITIGENNHWVVDGVDTGIAATGEKGEQGEPGEPGKGIVSITLKSSENGVDTYEILYTDESTSSFTVTNGKDGQKGEQGIQGNPGSNGKTPVITISEDGYWVVDGVKTNTLAQGPKGDKGDQGIQGEKGDTGETGASGKNGSDGRGIVSITLGNSKDGVDTYVILYSDSSTSSFTVTNGKDGTNGGQGSTGAAGQNGNDGITPHIDEATGHWFIGDTDTGIQAQGPKGDKGDKGDQGIQGIQGEKGDQGIQGEKGDTGAAGANGKNGSDGKSAYEIYCDAHQDYEKTEEEWMQDLVNFELAEKSKYTVTFDSNGGSEVDEVEVTSGNTILKPSNPTKDYCDFAGWYTDDGEEWNFKGCTVSSDITLTAKWIGKEYAINYHIGKADNSIKNPETYRYGDTFTLENPFKTNYSFAGWYLDQSFETPITEINSSNHADIDLYAKFTKEKFTVTFVNSYNFKYSAKTTTFTGYYDHSIDDFEYNYKNYSVEGVYLDSDLTKKVDDPTKFPNKNVTYYINNVHTGYTVSCYYKNFYIKVSDNSTYDANLASTNFSGICPVVYLHYWTNYTGQTTLGSFSLIIPYDIVRVTISAQDSGGLEATGYTADNTSRSIMTGGVGSPVLNKTL